MATQESSPSRPAPPGRGDPRGEHLLVESALYVAICPPGAAAHSGAVGRIDAFGRARRG